MDPNQTLVDLLVACEEGDREIAREALDNLRDWINTNGFLPEVKREDHRNFWIGVADNWTPTFKFRRLHRCVLAVAKTRREGTWAAYVVPVPGKNHEEELYLWETEGAKMLQSDARHFFPEFNDKPYAK